MTSAQPKLSLAMVCWNTRDLTLRSLASLRKAGERLALEVIVVDNASTDQTAEAVAREYPEVVLLRNTENRGFAAATNQALARARAPFWGFINPDTEVRLDALELLIEELEQHPEAGAAGPRLLNADFSLQPSGRKFPTLWRTFLQGILPARIKATAWWTRAVYGRTDFTKSAVVDEVSGACLVARRGSFEKAGLLDERFFVYYEEVDWFRRLRQTGQTVRYQPRAQVVHDWGAAVRQSRFRGILFHYQSEFAYWRKYGGSWGEIVVRGIAIMHALIWMLASLIRWGKLDGKYYWQVISYAFFKRMP